MVSAYRRIPYEAPHLDLFSRYFRALADSDGAVLIHCAAGKDRTGILAALLAQGGSARDALLASVHLHGAAADGLVAGGIGPTGLSAGELIDAARHCLNDWTRSR